MHHDESLHAYYAWKFFEGQGYSYNPLMHGPLQFEVVPLFYLLFGASEFSARLLAVLLGTALVFLPYFLRSYLTRTGALVTCAVLAVSPGMVYFSRFIRDDIYLACFSLVLFICIVRYIDTPRPVYLYVGAAAMALAMASMEAAYITFFIFGSFLLFAWLREYLTDRAGPITAAFKATSLDSLLTSLSMFIVITVLTYSTFFTNPYGIWDTQHGLMSSARQDVLGGLTYWQAQHSVQRGSQPWFYYLLVLPLYEQVAVVFGVAGAVYAAVRRSLATTFLVWWALMSLGMYSWAGEKMPWLSIHIALPLILLAGFFLGAAYHAPRRTLWLIAFPIFVVLLAVEVHSTFLLNYVDGADPTEMLIYVQTSQDVPRVVSDIGSLVKRQGAGKALPIGLDNADVGGWPFVWYLRDYPNVTETSTFSGPVCGTQYCPVLIMLQSEFDANSASLMKHYVAQKYRWNWWFPEDYKQWFPDHASALIDALEGKNNPISPAPSASEWNHLWNWLIYRTPFGDRSARWMYFLVRRDLVPGQQHFATSAPGSSGAAPLPPVQALRTSHVASFRSLGGGATLQGPRGLAVGRGGDVYVADPLAHRVAVFTAGGGLRESWGHGGTSGGSFALRDSPQGLGVGPDGLVYVADTWNQRIEVFSPSGRLVRMWGGGPIGNAPGQYYGPRGVAVSSDGKVYVADTGNKRIQVFTRKGKYLFSWGAAGTEAGQFQEPSSVAVSASGTVFVADFWNQRVQVFNSSGKYLRSWKVPEWTPGSYDEPYISVDPAGRRVYVTEPQQQRVAAYTATGRVVGMFGTDKLTTPVGVAALPNGKVAVSDPGAGQVDVFALAASNTR